MTPTENLKAEIKRLEILNLELSNRATKAERDLRDLREAKSTDRGEAERAVLMERDWLRNIVADMTRRTVSLSKSEAADDRGYFR